MNDIANGCAIRRSNNSDALRETRQGTFVSGIEQTFRLKLLLESFERGLESAQTLQLNRKYPELIPPSRLINRDFSLDHHFLAVLEEIAVNGARFVAKQNA